MPWLARWSNWALGLVLSGCFVDQRTGLDRICPAGEDTCICLEGQECQTGLTCMEDGRCRDPRCVDGRVDCKCIDGNRCDAGLECIDMSCLAPGGEDSTSSTGIVATLPTTDPSMTGPVETTTPVTSGPQTSSDSFSTSDTSPGSEVSGPVMTSNVSMNDTGVVSDTMGGSCNCGWYELGSYYWCGIDLPEVDPGGVDSPQCPNGTSDIVTAWMEDPGGAYVCPAGLTQTGCCFDGINLWCSAGFVQFEPCDPAHSQCPP